MAPAIEIYEASLRLWPAQQAVAPNRTTVIFSWRHAWARTHRQTEPAVLADKRSPQVHTPSLVNVVSDELSNFTMQPKNQGHTPIMTNAEQVLYRQGRRHPQRSNSHPGSGRTSKPPAEARRKVTRPVDLDNLVAAQPSSESKRTSEKPG